MLDRLPRSSVGEFDLVSGLIYMDCTEAEYEQLSAKRKRLGNRWAEVLSLRERLLVETSMHEYFHYLQLLSCGYLLEMVLGLLDSLQSVLTRLQHDGADDMRLSGFSRLAGRMLGAMDARESASALAPLDLVEGAAYHFQCRALGLAADHDGMLKELKRPRLNPVYRRAYERAAHKLDARAFAGFPLCAATALMFADPPAAYEELLAGLAAVWRKRGKRPPFGQTLEAIIARHTWIGSAVDVRKLRGEALFPWYEKPLARVAKFDSTPPAFFDTVHKKLIGQLMPPLVFRDSFRGDVGIPAMFAFVASRLPLRFTLPYTGST